MIRRPPRSTLFPYRRSSDLAIVNLAKHRLHLLRLVIAQHWIDPSDISALRLESEILVLQVSQALAQQRDRKSTRLNSSHVEISYAVFCLKKKKLISLNTSSC